MSVFKDKAKNQIVFFLALSTTLLFSCKAYRNPNNLRVKYPIESPELGEKMPGLQNLLIGDEIKVVGKDQSIRLMKFCGVDSDLIMGEMWKDRGKRLAEPIDVQIPLAEIEFINVKRNSPAGTATLIVGVGGVAAVSILLVTLSFVLKNIGLEGD